MNFLSSTVTILLVLHVVLSVSAAKTKTNQRAPLSPRISENNPNDTRLEFVNGCRCVIYYLCDNENYIITDGAGIFDVRLGQSDNSPKRISCSDPTYICCYNRTEIGASSRTIVTTTEEDSTEPATTEHSLTIFKNPNVTLGCGQHRTVFDPRISSPETDTSATLTGEIPWILAIFKRNSRTNSYQFKCVGSLIHPKVAMTSVPCIVSSPPDSLKLRATGNGLSQLAGPLAESERNVVKIIKHPEFYSGGLHNNIALVILETPFNFKLVPVNKICLPLGEDLEIDSRKCVAAGWGKSGVDNRPLKKVDLPLVEFDECQNRLRGTRLGETFILHESFLCAGGEGGKDTCTGDGGGPLMCLGKNRRYFQVGIVSWGIGCGAANVPGVYTDVAKFKNWIEEELEKKSILL